MTHVAERPHDKYGSAIFIRDYLKMKSISVNPDFIFACYSFHNMCAKSVLNPIPRTQHRPICVTVNHVLVSRPTAFRRRFNLSKANWSGYATNVDILIDEVDPIPENYEWFVEDIRVTSRKHIPRGCRSHSFF